MNIHLLQSFFMWCTILNTALLLLWAMLWKFFPEPIYRIQYHWCPVSREKINVLMYSFLGAYKLFVLGFNFIPWMALLIIKP